MFATKYNVPHGCKLVVFRKQSFTRFPFARCSAIILIKSTNSRRFCSDFSSNVFGVRIVVTCIPAFEPSGPRCFLWRETPDILNCFFRFRLDCLIKTLALLIDISFTENPLFLFAHGPWERFFSLVRAPSLLERQLTHFEHLVINEAPVPMTNDYSDHACGHREKCRLGGYGAN